MTIRKSVPATSQSSSIETVSNKISVTSVSPSPSALLSASLSGDKSVIPDCSSIHFNTRLETSDRDLEDSGSLSGPHIPERDPEIVKKNNCSKWMYSFYGSVE